MLTLNEQDEKVIDKIILAITTYIQIESIQTTPVSVLSFPGLEIRQHQHRVLQDRTLLDCLFHAVNSVV